MEKVSSVKCKQCVKYEVRIKSVPNFNNSRINGYEGSEEIQLIKIRWLKEAVKLATRDE